MPVMHDSPGFPPVPSGLSASAKCLARPGAHLGGAASMAVPHLALGRRRWRAVWVLLVVAALIVPKLAEPAAAAVATPAFVQARSKQTTSGTTNSLGLHQGQHGREPDRCRRHVEQHGR